MGMFFIFFCYIFLFNCILVVIHFPRIPITVPTGLADFPHELFPLPEPLVHKRFLDIVQFSEMPRGGHFAAFEEPELFANDVIKFVEKVEKQIAVKTTEWASKTES